MKNLILLFLFASLCVSCNSNLLNTDNFQYEKDHVTSPICEQLWESNSKLYPFIPFTDEEMKVLPYIEKIERRQIPATYIVGMSTKELFYQYVACELSGGMYAYNSAQAGFVAMTKQLNMLPALLNRSDAGKVLMELIEKIDLSKLNETECFHFYHCLERILVQPEVIGNMTDDEIDKFIQIAEHIQETVVRLSKTNENWNNPESLCAILFGLGNVMLKYEYEPFINLMGSNQDINGLMMGANLKNQQCIALINDCIKNFVKLKNSTQELSL
ncbi:MAG: hypothetical protein LBT25_04860 [Candidatus Symbiothrix sp.]|jgi:hypothetical protein|nr:hypothetical protein [Candidatus Symbiothrix sp.]